MATWFDQLRAVLHDYYPAKGPQDVVGYLRGSADPNIWRIMIHTRRPQMIILGSVPPTNKEWADAGVGGRSETQTIHLRDLNGLIVVYSGFMYRPWGDIVELKHDSMSNYHLTIASFRSNYHPPQP